jgi:hypothetical protein
MTTTVRKIGKIPIIVTKRHQMILKKYADFGNIDGTDISSDDPILIDLRKRAMACGYELVDDLSLYGETSYTFSAGSAMPHDDPGMGLTAAVLVATRDLSPAFQDTVSYCTFFAEGQHQEIQIGDVFVFDADKEHAWMANCRWLLAMQAIKLPEAAE